MAHPSDIKGKIRNLLALAESPNENEAKAALLKARELIAKHKLTEAELAEEEKQAVRDVRTDITCSKRRDPWIADLSAVIGENYCCKGYRSHAKGRQTQTIGFIGLEDDVEVCIAIFKYAVDCIRAGVKSIRKELDGYCPWYVKQQCDSYGLGFVNGIQTALRRQDEEKRGEFGLILAVDPQIYARGYAEGKEFDPAHRIGEGETA